MTITAQAHEALPEYELEFEDELELEDEDELELEDELALEDESEFEDEDELELEDEDELELEDESEEFFRLVGGRARRGPGRPRRRRTGRGGQGARQPSRRRTGRARQTTDGQPRRGTQQRGLLGRVALAAGRSVLDGLDDIGAAIGGPPGSMGARIGGPAGAAIGRILLDMLPQEEMEDEWEVNPIGRAYPDALMEHLGHAAATTESEAEAEAFVGALIPLAARLAPQAAGVIMRSAPQLARGVAAAARTLRSGPATRPLVRALPTVVRRTAQSIARQVAQGRTVTPQQAVRTLASRTARVISSPQQCVAAYRRSRALDRRYHRTAQRGTRQRPLAGPWRAPTPRSASSLAGIDDPFRCAHCGN